MSKKNKNVLNGGCNCINPKNEIKEIKIYIKRDKNNLKKIMKIRKEVNYDVGTGLESSIGRILYDIEIHKQRIKYLKRTNKCH